MINLFFLVFDIMKKNQMLNFVTKFTNNVTEKTWPITKLCVKHDRLVKHYIEMKILYSEYACIILSKLVNLTLIVWWMLADKLEI